MSSGMVSMVSEMSLMEFEVRGVGMRGWETGGICWFISFSAESGSSASTCRCDASSGLLSLAVSPNYGYISVTVSPNYGSKLFTRKSAGDINRKELKNKLNLILF